MTPAHSRSRSRSRSPLPVRDPRLHTPYTRITDGFDAGRVCFGPVSLKMANYPEAEKSIRLRVKG